MASDEPTDNTPHEHTVVTTCDGEFHLDTCTECHMEWTYACPEAGSFPATVDDGPQFDTLEEKRGER